ncbi:Gfo/Idh/MocA family protein [Nitrospinota bacterium]
MKTGNPVRACLVGLGWWGGEHARAAKQAEGLDLTACFARTPKPRESFAAEHGFRPFESWEAALKDGEVEALILATPHSTHARLVEEAASAGKHVFVEKPFVLHVPDGQRAIAACERAGVRLAVGHQRRYQPAHRELKRLIDAGELGHAIQADANFSYGYAYQMDPNGWRANPEESPAGPMTGLGVHHADTLQYLLGPIKSIFASCRPVNSVTNLDDVTSVLLEFESEAQGYLASNMLTPKVFYVQVYGTESNAFAEDEGRRLTLQRKGVEEPEVTEYEVAGDPVSATVVDELADFAAAIRENRPPEVDGAAGLRASAIVEGITISAREGRKVEMAELYE